MIDNDKNLRKLSFGVELELADVDCAKNIPSELGSWECGDLKNANGYYIGKETCIYNTDGSIVDPNKITCVKGGEVHVVPSYSIDTLMSRITDIFKIFPEAKMFLPGKMHVHVGIPDWTINEIKNLYLYTEDNDLELMHAMCPESWVKEMMEDTNLSEDLRKHYLSSRATITNPKCFKDILDFDTKKELTYWWGAKAMFSFPRPIIMYEGKQISSRQRIRVQSIHIQHLIIHNTVEFRNFASTMNLEEIRQCLLVAERYIREGLKGKEGIPIKDWIKNYHLPKWSYTASVIQSWWNQAKTNGLTVHTTSNSCPNASKNFHEMTVE